MKSDRASLADAVAEDVLAFQIERSGSKNYEDWATGALLSSGGAEWYILTLIQYDRPIDVNACIQYLDNHLSGERVLSASESLKYALAYCSLGERGHEQVRRVLSESIGAQGIMSYIYGLHLLNNGLESDLYTKQELIGELLKQRKADGGWAVMGSYSDTDVTAMALQALAPYYRSEPAVTEAVDGALDFLSQKQMESGAFVGFGGGINPESSAQVIIALCALKIDPLADARFIKNGNNCLDGLLLFRLQDGGFCHQLDSPYNATATLQSLMACVSLWRLYNGLDSLYLLDGVKARIEIGVTAEAIPTKPVSYKVTATLVCFDIALILALVLWLKGKRNYKNYIFLLVCFAAMFLLILLTDFQTTDAYYNGEKPEKPNAIGSVSMSIQCDTIKEYTSQNEFIPSDGIILPMTQFDIDRNETAYDILSQAAREYGIQMDSTGSGISMLYVKGINYIYEYEFGEQSGWMYYVNGIAPSVNAAEYTLSDGDVIQWMYSRDIGQDLKAYIITPEKQK